MINQAGICKKNIYNISKLPGKTEIELFEDILKTKHLHIERIISNGWNRVDGDWYDQENDEWVLLLKGYAAIEFENNQIIEMLEGDHIVIPSHSKHKVIKTSSEPPAVWLAVLVKNL